MAAVALFVALFGIGLVVPDLLLPSELIFQGKSVSAWMKELSAGAGSLGIRVSQGGRASSLRLFGSPGTNSAKLSATALYLPKFMRPKAGVTNVYIINDDTNADSVVMALGQTGLLSVTNARVSIGTQSNLLIFRSPSLVHVLRLAPGSSTANFAARNLLLPGPVREAPGLNLIYVYRDAGRGANPVKALEAIGAPAIPYLGKALRKRNGPLWRPYVKVYPSLARWLGWLGRIVLEPSPDAVFTRREAAGALDRMGPVAKLAAADLLVALKDPDSWVRYRALATLDKLSQQDAAIVPALAEAMKAMPGGELTDRVEQSRLNGPATVQALVAVLKHRQASVRADAVSQLERLGTRAKGVRSALVQTVRDEDRYVRARACRALGELKVEASVAVPPLIRGLDDPDCWVRGNAAEALGLYHVQAKAAVPRLLALRNATNGVERYCIRKALKQIDPETAKEAGVE